MTKRPKKKQKEPSGKKLPEYDPNTPEQPTITRSEYIVSAPPPAAATTSAPVMLVNPTHSAPPPPAPKKVETVTQSAPPPPASQIAFGSELNHRSEKAVEKEPEEKEPEEPRTKDTDVEIPAHDQTFPDSTIQVTNTVTLDPEQQDRLMMMRARQDEFIKERLGDDAVVMFTDTEDSTAYYERYGDSMGRQKMLTHHALIFPRIRAHKGSVVKTIGDGVMAFFPASKDAVNAARHMMQALSDFNENTTEEDEEIHIRVGIHRGPAYAEDGDLHGVAVTVASRIVQEAATDEVIVTQAVTDALDKESFESIPPIPFRGKLEPIRVSRLRWRDQHQSQKSAPARMLDKRYRLDHVLGRGQMGVVYDALDTRLNVPVAVKTFHSFVASKEHRQAVIEQIQTMASLRHDSILSVLDCSSPGAESAYYVTPKITSQSLATIVAEHGQLGIKRVLRLTMAIAEAIAFGHEHAVVHGNLKPENILVISHSPVLTRLKVGGFGLGKLAMRTLEDGQTLGPPAFFAPEQITGVTNLRPSADVYGLGALMYYLFSSKPPFESATTFKALRAAASGVYHSLDQHRPDLPEDLLKVVSTAMATRPDERYSTLVEFISALRPIVEREIGNPQNRPHNEHQQNQEIVRAKDADKNRTQDLDYGDQGNSQKGSSEWQLGNEEERKQSRIPTQKRRMLAVKNTLAFKYVAALSFAAMMVGVLATWLWMGRYAPSYQRAGAQNAASHMIEEITPPTKELPKNFEEIQLKTPTQPIKEINEIIELPLPSSVDN
ncbi:protein kinase [Myxococcota bacterium]|nr:protein kinase [Myxococcota bacterium]